MRTAVLANLSLVFALGACVELDTDASQDDELAETGAALTAPWVEFEPASSSEHFPNPERGFYTGYDLVAARDASSIRNAGYTLALSLVNLEDYRHRSLDSALLTSLQNGFARARAAGIKLIVRFAYNESGSEPDASKSRILGHITQLEPILRNNADVIAVLQAGFIGSWGEWHGSTNGLDSSSARGEILGALLSAMPWYRSVQVRTPMFKDAYRSGALTDSEAFGGSSKSRIGHHNDCFLASTSDFGTYAWPVDLWKSYVAADTRYSPMGGETCAVNPPRTSCDTAVAEMERHHWSYLNRNYKAAVIDGWIAGGCESSIRRRLGYRFVLRRVAHTERVAPGGILELELDIRNIGFAVPMNQRPVDIVLTRGSTRLTARLDEVDARWLTAGLKTTMTARLRVPANLAAGTYTVALRMPDLSSSLDDDPRYAIRFGNQGVWDPATGDNVLTRALVIDPAAPGAKDPSATKFVELP